MGLWIALLIAWGPLLWRLSWIWRSSPELWHGFAVPVLVVWLMCQRARVANASEVRMSAGGFWLGAAIASAAVLLGLVSLEANPLWPAPAWIATAGMCAWSWLVLRRASEGKLRGVFGPLCLIFTALPWPTVIYYPVMHALMTSNASVAAEIVSQFGWPAVVRGNVIEVATGAVGVDEACSGLRSLEAVVTMGLFLGVMLRLAWRRRALLLCGGILFAWVFNVLRTAWLTWLFARHGGAAEERWHDQAGVFALVLTVLAVMILAGRLERAGAGARARDDNESRTATGATKGSRLQFGRGPFVVAVVMAVLAESATQGWFLWHEKAHPDKVRWRLVKPDGSWRTESVPPRAATVLGYTSEDGVSLQTAMPPQTIIAFLFRWENDLAHLARAGAHDPLLCLPAVGARLEDELSPVTVEVEGQPVTFRAARFANGGVRQYVWFCLWNATLARPDATTLAIHPARERWQRVREGTRRDEREQMIFFVQGELDDDAARATLEASVRKLLRRSE